MPSRETGSSDQIAEAFGAARKQPAVRVDLRVPACKPVSDVVQFCQKAAEAGFSGVGFVDSHMFLRDIYVVMAQVLKVTKGLRVHPAVTCPGPRHPSVIASAAKTVQEFGPDRFELWLRRGASALRTVGNRPVTIGEMRQSIHEIRSLMAGESGVYPLTEESEAQNAIGERGGPRMAHGGGRLVPIHLAVGGPLIARLAGAVCDGVLLNTAPHKESIETMRAWVWDGAAKAGRDPREIDEWYQMRCLVRESREEAVRNWSPNVLRIVARDNAETWLADNDIAYRLTSKMKSKFRKAFGSLRSLYPEPSHIMDWEAAIRISEVIPYELQEAVGDRMAVLGPAEYVSRRIGDLRKVGCNSIWLHPTWTFELPEPELMAFRQVIFPAIAQVES